MAVSTGPTGDSSEETPQDAAVKFEQWLHENNYVAAVEICPYDGREGGFQFAVDAWEVAEEYLGDLKPEPGEEDRKKVMDYAMDVGQFADPKVYAARDEEHEKEERECAASEMAQLLFAYGVWPGGDPTTHQFFEHIPPHGCNFVWWLRDKKCTRNAGVTTRHSWTRPTQQLLAEFLASDYGKKHVSDTDVERLTAWVTEKLMPELRMDVTPAAADIEKYRMFPMPMPFQPPAPLTREDIEQYRTPGTGPSGKGNNLDWGTGSDVRRDANGQPLDVFRGKTAAEWYTLYSQLVSELRDLHGKYNI